MQGQTLPQSSTEQTSISDPTVTSPLNEITDEDITLDELFRRKPIELTDRQLNMIVQELRAQRATFKQVEEKKASTPRKSMAKDVDLDQPMLPHIAEAVADLDL